MKNIEIRGARTHNLQNIDVDLPRDRLIVITGLSGSGKSSLAFDTIFAVGQRRYVESLSAYARIKPSACSFASNCTCSPLRFCTTGASNIYFLSSSKDSTLSTI